MSPMQLTDTPTLTRPDFAAVYDRILPRLTRFIARSHLADRSLTPQDVAQAAFVKAWLAWPTFDYRSDQALEDWLFRIAVNLLRDAHRHAQVVQFTPLDKVPSVQSLPSSDPLDDPLFQVTREEDRTAIFSLLPSLSPIERAIYLACDVQRQPMAVAAQNAGISLGACKSALLRARTRLARLMGLTRRTRPQSNSRRSPS